ncbi:lipid A export permease/ATP-binding protein MsbA [Dyella flava]|uniref:Lipid A export permease/ATP-binding protein MsbA n=1 Tax=Dyella flava TaxID=1920170 RepID=A0ABS2K3R8_9GAMM|nr:lipid A export permease/ATP-binding protein MsbA [Dyella flava]MBM7125880.1 lipid A export permease/ATP-binding protein MsbA [Dyella flava]GLQ48603.1 lipid A export ATP-binding/permease protein MsbA [Dyella flava]
MSEGKKKVALWDAESRQVYKRLLGYSARYWPILLISIIGFVVDGGAIALFTKKLQPIMDNLLTKKDPYLIHWMPIWIICIFLVRGVAIYISNYGMGYVGRNVVQTMQRDVFGAYLRLPVTYFGNEHSGHQVSRITFTSEQIAGASTDALKIAITEGVTVIGMFIVMLQESVYLSTALLVLVPAIVLITTAVSRRYRVISRRIQGMMGSVTGTVEEMLQAHREVRIYAGQEQAAERFKQVSGRARYLNLKIVATSALSGSTVQSVASFSLAGMVFLASRPSVIDSISPGVFIAVIGAMGGMLSSLKRLSNVQSTIQTGISAAENLFALIDTPSEVDNGTAVLQRTRGDLRFENVRLIYPRGEFEALSGVDLHCAPGTVTALVGRSGSGKSSLVSLLPRFNEPTNGRILLDGADYESYTLASLRKQIAWVGQQVVLFDGTVAENIAYGELAGATEQEIIAAAEAANAMEFIAKLPNGIHNQIGEGGNMLSGGQRQRIAIARAILKNAPILVLDEATSALDTESERLIQQALQRLMRDRTTLVIAHRLSTIEHADQIAVMDHGHVIERGTHAELIAMSGHYAALHRMQFNEPSVAVAAN